MWTAFHQAKMELEMLRNPWPYAYYQASRVVTARSFEWTVTETCLRPRIHSFHGFFELASFSYGTTNLPESNDMAAGEREASESYAMYLLAGSVAESRFDPNRQECGNNFDPLEAKFAVARYADCREEKYLEWLKARVVRLINHSWPSIELVTAALVERRRLTGQEIDMMLKRFSPKAVR